jgi:hypothetical protein
MEKDMSNVSITLKVRNKKGRWTTAKSVKFNDFYLAIKPGVLEPDKPSFFDYLFMTKKYRLYLEKKAVKHGVELQRIHFKTAVINLLRGKK